MTSGAKSGAHSQHAPTYFYRYDYAHLDFSPLREPGLYAIEYAGHQRDAVLDPAGSLRHRA